MMTGQAIDAHNECATYQLQRQSNSDQQHTDSSVRSTTIRHSEDVAATPTNQTIDESGQLAMNGQSAGTTAAENEPLHSQMAHAMSNSCCIDQTSLPSHVNMQCLHWHMCAVEKKRPPTHKNRIRRSTRAAQASHAAVNNSKCCTPQSKPIHAKGRQSLAWTSALEAGNARSCNTGSQNLRICDMISATLCGRCDSTETAHDNGSNNNSTA